MQEISLRNLLLYGLLLIFTPFILLQNYFQWAIANASRAQFDFLGISVPYILVIVSVLLLVLLMFTYKLLNRRRIIIIIIIILLWLLGQNATDYYFGHKFYELQHNWHYMAYGTFSFIIHRYLVNRNISSSKIILITLVAALSLSVFDELIQIPLSDRFFDICDIAKDFWGATIGLYIVFFIVEDGQNVKAGLNILKPTVKEYFNSPFSLLIFFTVLAYLFLTISSILTESIYIGWIVLITIGLFLLFFLIIHQFQFKKRRILFSIILGFLILLQAIFFFSNSKENVIYRINGITIYKGIPLLFFDTMINPNGTFRFVDKKTNFNFRDKITILNKDSDIIIFGTGSKQKLNIGFSEEATSQFVYNNDSRKLVQVIILDSQKACDKYNELKEKNLNVLLILHNE